MFENTATFYIYILEALLRLMKTEVTFASTEICIHNKMIYTSRGA